VTVEMHGVRGTVWEGNGKQKLGKLKVHGHLPWDGSHLVQDEHRPFDLAALVVVCRRGKFCSLLSDISIPLLKQ
jgi:hypothetical protein